VDEYFKAIVAESKLPENIARQLTDAGYVVIEGPVAHNKSEQLAKAYDAAVLTAHPDDVRVSSSTRISDFVNRGPDFDELYLYKPLLAACCQIIARPFRLSTMHARTLEPGSPKESLHVDFERVDDGWPMVGFIIMVDEFRSDNGATRFVPGSHMKNPTADDVEVMACGPAGSIIIYNGSVCMDGRRTGRPSLGVRFRAPLSGGSVNRAST